MGRYTSTAFLMISPTLNLPWRLSPESPLRFWCGTKRLPRARKTCSAWETVTPVPLPDTTSSRNSRRTRQRLNDLPPPGGLLPVVVALERLRLARRLWHWLHRLHCRRFLKHDLPIRPALNIKPRSLSHQRIGLTRAQPDGLRIKA